MSFAALHRRIISIWYTPAALENPHHNGASGTQNCFIPVRPRRSTPAANA
jgi:hypothetical protein